MALFGRDDYNWLSEAWARVIDSAPTDEQTALKSACVRFATLLAENSRGFNSTRFITNVLRQTKTPTPL